METLEEILEDLDEIVKNTRFNLPDLSADLWAIERRLRDWMAIVELGVRQDCS